MKRLSEQEAENVDTDPSAPAEPGQDPSGSTATHKSPTPAGNAKHPSQAENLDDMFPDGTNVVEGELPASMFERAGEGPGGSSEGEAPGAGEDGQPGEEAEGTDQSDQPDQSGTDGEDVDHGDDVNTSATIEKVRKRAGVDVEDEDDLVDTLKAMRRDLQGTQEFRQLFDEVPELGQVVEGMMNAAGDEGQIDTASFLLALEDVPGVDVGMPDPSEAPDEYDEFRLELKDRRRKIQEQRRQQQELQQTKQEIQNDYERAFEQFKKRQDLDDDAAQEFKDWFARTFYGDYEKGMLPRDDIFDIAYREYADENDDTPVEQTDATRRAITPRSRKWKATARATACPT